MSVKVNIVEWFIFYGIVYDIIDTLVSMESKFCNFIKIKLKRSRGFISVFIRLKYDNQNIFVNCFTYHAYIHMYIHIIHTVNSLQRIIWLIKFL